MYPDVFRALQLVQELVLNALNKDHIILYKRQLPQEQLTLKVHYYPGYEFLIHVVIMPAY